MQIYFVGTNSTILLITQRKYTQIQLATKKASPIIPKSTEGTSLNQTPLQGGRVKRGSAGSGERGRMPIIQSPGKTTPLDIADHLLALASQMFNPAPDRTVSTGGRGRPAPWSPRKRSRGRGRERESCLVRSVAQGESRRPSRRGVTQVLPRREKKNARGRLSPTKEVTGGCRAHRIPGPDPVRPREARSLRVRAIKRKVRRAAAVTAKRVSAVGPERKFMFARTSGASEGRGAVRGKARGPAV